MPELRAGAKLRASSSSDFSFADAALGASVTARVVHQDLPHQMSGHSEEVRSALPIGKALSDEAQERLMDQHGRLQRSRGAPVSEAPLRETALLLVNDRHEESTADGSPRFRSISNL